MGAFVDALEDLEGEDLHFGADQWSLSGYTSGEVSSGDIHLCSITNGCVRGISATTLASKTQTVFISSLAISGRTTKCVTFHGEGLCEPFGCRHPDGRSRLVGSSKLVTRLDTVIRCGRHVLLGSFSGRSHPTMPSRSRRQKASVRCPCHISLSAL